MGGLRLASAFALVLGLAGCGVDDGTQDVVMPDVVGLQLDVALSDIERAGYEEDVDILGGGTFGIVNESNWQVCDQSPAAGEVVSEEPRLTVDRECESDDGDEAQEDEPSSDGDETPDGEPSTSGDAPVEERDAIVDPDEVLSRILSATPEIETVDDLCRVLMETESAEFWYSHWSCWYEEVTVTAGYLKVHLTTDGGRTDDELSDMAAGTGMDWWNLIGCEYAELDVIVVTINGRDYNAFRHDAPLAADSYCDS